MILFVNVLFVLYLLMILFFLIGWFSNNYKESKKKNRLSVVIAVRNEQDNIVHLIEDLKLQDYDCLLYTSPSPRDGLLSRMPSSA